MNQKDNLPLPPTDLNDVTDTIVLLASDVVKHLIQMTKEGDLVKQRSAAIASVVAGVHLGRVTGIPKETLKNLVNHYIELL